MCTGFGDVLLNYSNLISTILGSLPFLVRITWALKSLCHCIDIVSGIVVFIILLLSYLILIVGSGKSSFLTTSIVFIFLGEWLTFNCVSPECKKINQIGTVIIKNPRITTIKKQPIPVCNFAFC